MNVEPIVVSATTIVHAWRQSAQLLIHDGAHFNLVVHISDPSIHDPTELSRLNPKNVDGSADSLYDVANTIFPAEGPKWNLRLSAFSRHYITAYQRLARSKPQLWGFYFQRLVAFGPGQLNQLVTIVDGLNGWGRNHRAAFVAHLSSSVLDRPRPRGGPCWQYAQFMHGDNDKLVMTAVYRSHDYFLKALGNFVGLSRVQRFICQKTGLSVGPLSCLSTYAFLGRSRKKTKELLGLT